MCRGVVLNEQVPVLVCVCVCVAVAAVQQRGQTAVKPAADRRCG